MEHQDVTSKERGAEVDVPLLPAPVQHPSGGGSLACCNSKDTGHDAVDSSSTVAMSVGFYMVSAITMVLANKSVLNAVPDLPLVFLLGQLIMAVVMLRGASVARFITLPALTAASCREVMSVSVLNVVTLALNTYCLRAVDASLFQVARGLVIPFTVALTAANLHGGAPTRISPAVLVCCLLICLGFTTGMLFDAASPSYTGASLARDMTLGALASAACAVHAVAIKRVQARVARTLDLAYLSNAVSAVLLVPVIACTGELGALAGASAETVWRPLAHGILVTGVLGFLINVAGLLQIKVTSPLSHMVSSAARGVLQTGAAALVLREVVGPARMAGIALISAGSMGYVWAKSREAAAGRGAGVSTAGAKGGKTKA
ncbi:hypothetical protein H9P43_003342 [Blastocladiella emersonii ATCC 22665]|nr:hypothetical protein H9P43_003342 [Blastocladiella emersonii ATCC 22665]